MTTETVEAAQIVLPCKDLDATLAFFTERLGFRLETIHPADDPSVAVISGYGVRLELARGGDGAPGVLRLLCDDPRKVADGAAELMAPNGTRIELVDANPPLVVPATKSSFVLSRNDDEAPWHAGRAGMRYRDLIPDRLGGAFIASHIQVPDAGLVPDYVHFHKIRFQMIYAGVFIKDGFADDPFGILGTIHPASVPACRSECVPSMPRPRTLSMELAETGPEEARTQADFRRAGSGDPSVRLRSRRRRRIRHRVLRLGARFQKGDRRRRRRAHGVTMGAGELGDAEALGAWCDRAARIDPRSSRGRAPGRGFDNRRPRRR